jgi:hypothetical protein
MFPTPDEAISQPAKEWCVEINNKKPVEAGPKPTAICHMNVLALWLAPCLRNLTIYYTNNS